MDEQLIQDAASDLKEPLYKREKGKCQSLRMRLGRALGTTNLDFFDEISGVHLGGTSMARVDMLRDHAGICVEVSIANVCRSSNGGRTPNLEIHGRDQLS